MSIMKKERKIEREEWNKKKKRKRKMSETKKKGEGM